MKKAAREGRAARFWRDCGANCCALWQYRSSALRDATGCVPAEPVLQSFTATLSITVRMTLITTKPVKVWLPSRMRSMTGCRA